MRSPSASRLYSSQRTRPEIPWRPAGSAIFIGDPSIDRSRRAAAHLLEGSERGHFHFRKLHANHRRSPSLRSSRQGLLQFFDRPAIACKEPREHRAKAGAEVRSPERVVTGVVAEEQPFAN